MDTLRADRILLKPKDFNFSPFIHKLLDHSIFFNNCISNSTWTLPAHISMFTGLYESQNFHLNQNLYELNKKIPTLAEILKNYGYSTFCYSENPWISNKTGLTRGFDIIFEKWMNNSKYKIINKFDSFIKSKISSHIPLNFWQIIKDSFERFILHFTWKDYFFGGNRKSLTQTHNFIKQYLPKANPPSFIFFNIMANHAPFYSTKKALDAVSLSYKDFKTIKKIFLFPMRSFIKINFGVKSISKKKVDILKKFYDASVLYSDSVVKHIFFELKKLGFLQNSIIIITSDHGELLADQNDHYYWTHGIFHSVYDALIKIPMIIYSPKFKSKVVEDLVQLKDLYHTILDFTNTTKNKNNYLNKEKSFMFQIKNNAFPRYIIGEFIKDKQEMTNRINFHRDIIKKNLVPRLFSNIFYVRSKNHKYIRYSHGIEEFYDLQKDLYEKFNIIDENNEIYKNMNQIIKNFIKDESYLNELRKIVSRKEKRLINETVKNINFTKFK